MRPQCAALGLLWVVASVAAFSYTTGDVAYDRPFGDLPSMPMHLPAGSTADTCQAICNKTQECVAWAFGVVSTTCDAPLSCWLKQSVTTLLPNPCRVSGTKDTAPSQLSCSLAGHLQYFYPTIENSTWIGGTVLDPAGVNERVPYWLNGMVPLVYQLDDAPLRASVESYLAYISAHQNASGWLGPEQSELPGLDPWPRYPLMLAFKAHYEATGDNVTLTTMLKFLYFLRNLIDTDPLTIWAQYRYMDLHLTLHWALDQNLPPSPQYWFDFAETVNNQGFDWASFYTSDHFPKSACLGSCQSLATHGVNNGQALKSGAVWWRQNRSQADVTTTYQRIGLLQQYHGQADGMFSCSEHLAGLDASQGTELCTIVETMYSYAVIGNILGDLTMFDRVEQLAYNALPAAIDPHMWAHVYLNQANNIASETCNPPIYVSDGPESNLYGLEPNFGCCTVNFPQGWPKFVANMYAAGPNDSIAVLLYGPSEANLTTAESGNQITITQSTNYPFSGVVNLTIATTRPQMVTFRIPGWAAGTVVTYAQHSTVVSGTSYSVTVAPPVATVTLEFQMGLRVVSRPNNAVALYWGPLLLSLQIAENWTQLAHYEFNSSDWQITPASPWAYALLLNSTSPASSCSVTVSAPGDVPFAPSTATSSIVAKCYGRAIAWSVYRQAAQAPPASPITSTAPLVGLTLVPYGTTQLRISEFPVLRT